MDKPFLAETKRLFAHVRHHNSDALEVRCDDDFGSINSNAGGGTPVVRDRAG